MMRLAVVIVIALGAGCSSTQTVTGSSATNPAASVTTASVAPARGNEVETPPLLGVARSVVQARAAHTATTLLGGGVLVAGGCVTDGCRDASNETFLVSSDGATIASGPAMSVPRDAHTATLLDDGRVVLIGGYPGEGAGVLDSIDVIDPRSMTTTAQMPLSVARGGHAAAATVSGDVLVVGGWIGPRTYTASVEMFEPAAGRVRALADAPYGADALDAVELRDGRVLVTGGQVAPGQATASAATFDPGTGSWSRVGDLSTPRFKHFSVVLPDGRVLVMGGTTDDRTFLNTTEIFDPVANAFTPGPDMSEPRYKLPGGAVVLGDGRVAIAGGGRTTEILDVSEDSSLVVTESDQRGSFATINLLGSGDLLVLGGYDDAIRLRNEMMIIPAPTIQQQLNRTTTTTSRRDRR